MAAKSEHVHTPMGAFPTGDSSIQLVSKIPRILPHERVFPIQIGSELFKLSGASLSSDAPSYFSQYFQCQIKQAEEKGEDIATAIRTLYIDRDPVTFKDISLHLQGYHVQPRDGTHFVRLFADAQFYSLPKLISQLYEESIFMSIGHREFQIPRDLFTDPGNSPNFFSLGFAIFFSSPDDLFPGLDREGLIRPPSILPPGVPHRSAETFAELLHFLRGYPVSIRDDAHRQSLLRDCRYFNFKGLEQRLIPHCISFNQTRQREEITLRLEDILKSGITIQPEPTPTDPHAGWVTYARPYVDDRAYELVLEIGGEMTRLQFPPGGGGEGVRAEFFRDARARLARLFEVIATKLDIPLGLLGLLMSKGGANSSQPATPGNNTNTPPLSTEDLLVVRVVMDPQASIMLDGRPWVSSDEEQVPTAAGGTGGQQEGSPTSTMQGLALGQQQQQQQQQQPGSRKRRRVDDNGTAGEGLGGDTGAEDWIVKTGQWRLRIQVGKNEKAAVECVLVPVKIEAFSCEQARNAQRGFLS
ncbi:hypothetical protein QBC46DRAFT_316149 [Diplogelasinospora grovesii]|uniref:Potassium channel tetramerisation-type BTB domain-containing protein n=1 Tax=Diplogelasinospora grovesii TaxID=303347 RepID=A0AAN6N655_9PEZI|nr:hypothetical protein QBC46DRAFT_316149 [Diplogelasinospora grovesii]